MRNTLLKAFGSVVLMVWSSMTYAVGFGGINVTSALGQPLVAEIDLVAVEPADKQSLNARLASPEAFKGAGIDYPYGLPKLKFAIETRDNGDTYIKATSTQPINEPFVSLLIELGWSSGRLLREYTFLLDPPGFIAQQAAPAVVKPVEPAAPAVVAPAVPVPESAPVAAAVMAPSATESQATTEAAPTPAPVATTETEKPAPTEVAAVVAPKEETKPAATTKLATQVGTATVAVKPGDTLGKIATKTKAADVSLERMLVGLYRANTDAFDGNNMNRLKSGKILRLPASEELEKVQQAEAVSEVNAQVADWNAYRQKLAATTSAPAEQRAKQAVAGKITTSLSDKAAEPKEPAKEVLKLSKGEAPGDQSIAGGKASDKANAKAEDAIAKAKALKEAEQRAAILEKNVKDMQRLMELKSQAEAGRAGNKETAASAPASALPLVGSAVAPASEVVAASAVAAPKAKVAAPVVMPPPPSMIDEILENPIYLGAGAAVVLGLAGLVVVRARQKKTAVKTDKSSDADDIGSATGRIAAPVVPSPETGDFTSMSTAPLAGASEADEVDPIGEAELFLNFGRDQQAEEVLKEALKKDPANNPIKLKLLSIYANRKDTKSFYVYALEIKDSGDLPAWEQAAAMGRTLEPNNAFYGGAAELAAAPVEIGATSPEVDFDLGLGDETVEPAADIPATPESTVVMTPTELREAQDAPMDFDITGTAPVMAEPVVEAPPNDLAVMDFDITGTASSLAAAPTEETAKPEMSAMDFDLSSLEPTAPPLSAEAAPAPALNLDDLVFDVTASHPTPAPVEDVPPVAIDPGMEFTLDLPTDVPAAEAKSASPVKDVGLSEISLSLDEPAVTPASSEPKGEQWQEVATKLDLAKAYQEMGDQDGAREILDEVLRDGDAEQQETARMLLQQLS